MKKIKILEAIRQGQFGGGESHVFELSTYLDKSVYEPVVLSFTAGPMVDELSRRGIKTKVIFTEKAFDLSVWKQVRDFVKEEKIDIVHAHGTRAASNVFQAAKNLRLPLIYTVHGWSFHSDQNFFHRKIREFFEKFLTSKADKTICVSKCNEQYGIEHFNLKRSIVIYNAVDLEKFNPEKEFSNIRKELGINQNKTVVGYIARITVQKDPFTMLRTMQEILKKTDDILLLMVGDGDLKEKSVKLAQQLNIENNVLFQPYRSDIPDILNAIDIYCLPSLWEGLPIGIIEAMAMGKVVVATSVDGSKELIEAGKTGFLVTPGKPEELAETLLLLHDHAELRRSLGGNALVYAKNGFGIKRMVDDVQVVYQSFI